VGVELGEMRIRVAGGEGSGKADGDNRIVHAMEDSRRLAEIRIAREAAGVFEQGEVYPPNFLRAVMIDREPAGFPPVLDGLFAVDLSPRSEEHTSELQS